MAESDFQMMKKDVIEGMKKDKLITIAMAILYLIMTFWKASLYSSFGSMKKLL